MISPVATQEKVIYTKNGSVCAGVTIGTFTNDTMIPNQDPAKVQWKKGPLECYVVKRDNGVEEFVLPGDCKPWTEIEAEIIAERDAAAEVTWKENFEATWGGNGPQTYTRV